MSFYGIGSIMGAYLGGWITDRSPFKKIMIFSLISSSIILSFLLVTKSLPMICLTIFGYALTADIFRPANSKAILIYSNPENRTRSVSLYRLAINLGFSVGPAIGGFIAFYLGYKWLFVIDSATSLMAAAMLYYFLPKSSDNDQVEKSAAIEENKSAYRDWKYLIFILLVAIYGICFFQLSAAIPQYLHKMCNYSESSIGLLIGLNGFLVVLIEMPLVAALENKRSNFTYIFWGGLFIPIAMLVMKFTNGSLYGALIYIILITISEMLCMPFMLNFVISRASNSRQGQYAALYSMAYGIAHIFAPLLGLGIANKFGFGVMFYFFIGFGILGAFAFKLLEGWKPK